MVITRCTSKKTDSAAPPGHGVDNPLDPNVKPEFDQKQKKISPNPQ